MIKEKQGDPLNWPSIPEGHSTGWRMRYAGVDWCPGPCLHCDDWTHITRLLLTRNVLSIFHFEIRSGYYRMSECNDSIAPITVNFNAILKTNLR